VKETHWGSSYGIDICLSDGWLAWLRKVDNSVNFKRNWNDYKKGFGDRKGNFWLGLETLHNITKSGGRYKLRAEMESWQNETSWAEYWEFSVASEADKYRLTFKEYDSISSASDAFYHNNNQNFSTYDEDNDAYDESCAPDYQGGFWFGDCSVAFPTSPIKPAGHVGPPWNYMHWSNAFENDSDKSLKTMSLMIKPWTDNSKW